MTKTILGISVNSTPELDTELVRKTVGHIGNTDINLLKTDFLTKEKVKRGNEITDEIFAEVDKQFLAVPRQA